MSHFTVMVKIDKARLAKNNSIEAVVRELLLPYCEETSIISPEYLKFTDTEDEYYSEYVKHINEPNYSSKESPMSFEDYVSEFYDRKRDPKSGRYGYYSNPNATWDWYQIGGRWDGMLRLKKHNKHCNYAKIEDIDWDYYINAATVSAKEAYFALKPFFDRCLAGEDPNAVYNDLEANATKYAQEIADKKGENSKAAIAARIKMFQWVWDYLSLLRSIGLLTNKNFNVSAFPESEEEFVKRFSYYWDFSTYAVVEKDGKWLAKGEMGWFGNSSESPNDAQAWSKSFYETFIKNEESDTTIVIVDCHI